jgi:predicted site-specific integrase-resolvase
MIAFITNKEAKAILGVNRETLQKYVHSGKLKKFKTPTGRNRYDLSEVGSLIQEVVTK